jgi:haloalkane dehalogenase
LADTAHYQDIARDISGLSRNAPRSCLQNVQTTEGAPQRTEDRVLGLRYRSVSLASGDIGYVDEGAGPTVLLLHGAPLTSLGFLRVIRELAVDYRVVAPDLPGFGRSSIRPQFGASLADYSAFVADFCRALELRHFFAYLNDSSACIAFPALAGLADRVAGIVVASTVPLPLSGRSLVVKFTLRYIVGSSAARSLNRRLNLLPWLVATVAPWLRPFSASERQLLRAQFDTREKRDRIIDIFRQMGRDDSFMQRAAASARTHLGRKPVLLLYGQFDPMRLVGGVSRFRQMFPSSTVRIVPLEEHFPILASGARVARTVHEWIRSQR